MVLVSKQAMRSAVFVVVAIAAVLVATVDSVPITANGIAVSGSSNATTPFTFQIGAGAINANTDYWFIVTIVAGFVSSNSTINITTHSSSQLFSFGGADYTVVPNSGLSTNGQFVVSIDARSLKLFVTATNTQMTFWVTGGGVPVPYTASLYSRLAVNVIETEGGVGDNGVFGQIFTGTVPCCGARIQLTVETTARVGQYLTMNATTTNNTAQSATVYDFGVAGAPNRVYFPADGHGTVQAQTCSTSATCTVVANTYYVEIQSAANSEFALSFKLGFTYLAAANSPSNSGQGMNISSTGTGPNLNSAPAVPPSATAVLLSVTLAMAVAVLAGKSSP